MLKEYELSNKINEECGIFAIHEVEDAVSYGYYGLHTLQHRGQEGAGIASLQKDEIHVYKGHGLLSEIFNKENLEELKGNSMVGHVRYATCGGKEIENVQPIMVRSSMGDFALAHNGNIVNAAGLREQLEQVGSIFRGSSDSEVIAHLIQRASGSFIEKLKIALQQLEGAFALVVMNKDAMYACRDRNGLRPLSIGTLQEGYAITSETCAFEVVGAMFEKDLAPAEIVEMKDGKMNSTFYTKDTQHCLCAMEYIYFSRPDSDLDGVNVHAARKRSGELLAKEEELTFTNAIVVGVPDSSLSAAMGYAQASGLPYEMGLIKNRYVARTFIQPTQAQRERGVRMKLSAVHSIVRGKTVILVDDSIVRGTTSKRIVRLLKEAGAQEVHVRIASPKISHPCFYGVDTSNHDELIGGFQSTKQIEEFIEADSLSYLTMEHLDEAIGNKKSCKACFGQGYPTALFSYQKQVKEIV